LPRGAQIIITPWLFHLFSRHYAINRFATLSSPFIIAADTQHIDTRYAMIAFDITFTSATPLPFMLPSAAAAFSIADY
jgi:hypothetical protein